ncbi:flagellin [Cryobacterium sp. Hz9]|uniref:flagellin N-terminal helical domain-containing protein n=1 Tax=Cryobacterium sp. Hz9 TaxID=1259167 RepID=UPI00106D2947|nr:flagellin [Cryobacterium sp. Hz9]TFB66318.1 flagellin [Cryobacterium sp. Hz9]
MGMQVNTNIAANNAYRNLATTQNDLSKSLEKLSSGLRINRAADDAAGLTISEGLKSQVGGLTVASRNAQDAISVIQTAEGSLNEVQSILQRVRDLAVQAGNDSNNSDSRIAIQTEVTALTDELDRIGKSTNFNGRALLDGTASLSFQIGANGNAVNDRIAVDLTGTDVDALAARLTTGVAGGKMDVLTPSTVAEGDQTFTITNADGSSSPAVAKLGAAGSYDTVQELATAMNAQESFSSLAKATVDSDNKLVVTANNGGAITHLASNGIGEATTTGVVDLDFTSAAGAARAIGVIDTELKAISTSRAELGAVQNRFESVIKNLAVSKENLTAAGSRIRDTDMAEEMVKYTRANILSQAGTAMLAQANQSNSGVLQLLQ